MSSEMKRQVIVIAQRFKPLPDLETIRSRLYELMVYTHRGSISQAADLLGLSYPGLHDRLTGRGAWSGVEVWNTVRACHAVTGDEEIASWLVGEGWRVTPNPEVQEPDGDIQAKIADVSDAAGRLRQTVKKAQEDGKISPDEIDRIKEDRAVLARELAEADKLLEDLKKI